MTAYEDLLIGIDGGGSNTRIVVSDTNGNVIVYQNHNRAASLHKDLQAIDNVQMAIRLALAETGRLPRQVCGIAAGIAGFDTIEDLTWVQELTNLEDVSCSRWHVNDAVVAHYGAHIAKPGIVVIAGTGSILFGINEEGSHFRNFDFHHYAASAARFLSYDAVYEALAGHTDDSDQLVIEAMLAYWGVANLTKLSNLGEMGSTQMLKNACECSRHLLQFSQKLL